METKTDPDKAPDAAFDPLAGWEVASRWNAATFDWMTKGFRQWLALVTTLPRRPAVSLHPQAKTQAHEERPVAQAEPKHPARAKNKTKAKSKARARD
jgi:hypothetical protein